SGGSVSASNATRYSPWRSPEEPRRGANARATIRAMKKTGHSFADQTAVMILRSGGVLTQVSVLEKTFSIDTPDFGVLDLPRKQIKTIIYKNLPTYPPDFVKTMSGSELTGSVLNDPVRVSTADTGTISIAKSKIISIVW